jgi:hypothetical protein
MSKELNGHRDKTDYVSYLLRIWRVSQAAGTGEIKEATWHASLESPHTGERWGFSGLEALCEFLREQIDLLNCGSADDGQDRPAVDRAAPGAWYGKHDANAPRNPRI